MTIRTALTTIALCCVLPLAGCFSYQRAGGEPGPSLPLPQDAWVRSDVEPLRPLLETPPTLRRYRVDRERIAEQFPRLTPEQLDAVVEKAADLHAIEMREVRLAEGGLLRLWHDTREPDADTSKPMFFSFGGRIEHFTVRGSFLTPDQHAWLLAEKASRERHGLKDRPRYTGTDVRGVTRTNETDRWLLDAGYSLGYAFPDGEPAGLVIHLTSMIENKYEHAVVRRLKRRGWAVAHVETHLGVRGPLAERAMDRRHEREALLESRMPLHPEEFSRRTLAGEEVPLAGMSDYVTRRFELGQQLKKELPDLGTGFELGPDTDPDTVGDAIAEAVDRRLSEHADAAAALVASLEAMRPELAGRPLLVTGFSAGALAAPAVAARLREAYPDRPIGIVLVGGGGSLLDIALGSELTDGGIRLTGPGAVATPGRIAAVVRRYESRSRLDPISLATALRGIPVFHAYADKDTAVPTRAAERFNAAHGAVDRLVHRGNHDTLLFFANSQAGRIRSWIRDRGLD